MIENVKFTFSITILGRFDYLPLFCCSEFIYSFFNEWISFILYELGYFHILHKTAFS